MLHFYDFSVCTNKIKRQLISKFPFMEAHVSFNKTVRQEILENFQYFETDSEVGCLFLLQLDDMKDFSSKFSAILTTILPLINAKILDHLGMVVSRLAVLNSMKGTLALLHDKIAMNKRHKIHVTHFILNN